MEDRTHEGMKTSDQVYVYAYGYRNDGYCLLSADAGLGLRAALRLSPDEARRLAAKLIHAADVATGAASSVEAA